jgi:hypothetical protein
MKKKELLVSVFFGMAFSSFSGCSTSDKAVVSPAANDGVAAADSPKKFPR